MSSQGEGRAEVAAGHETLWTGWDPAQGSDVPPEAALGQAPATEEDQYALLALAGRGFRPPGYLTVRHAANDDAGDDVSTPPIRSGLRPAWSMVYRRIAETGQRIVPPFAIYLLGVNPPAGASETELEEFNEFYTNVHLVEVAERRQALRGVRFELVHEIQRPAKGAPRFLATYEVDEAGASQRRHVGPPYSKGPDVWNAHTTPWRIWFRRIGG